jgi:hypothetical protein
MERTTIHEELNEKQEKKFRTWLSHIKALYGEYGTITWSITPTGIGSSIKVYSHSAKVELDLTDVDSW